MRCVDWNRKGKQNPSLSKRLTDLHKNVEEEEATAEMLAVEFAKTDRELQELQCREMLTGVETTTFGERVYKLMLEIIPKQLPNNPELAIKLVTVRASMAELFSLANEKSETGSHIISSEPG